jgi:hypothetical protein
MNEVEFSYKGNELEIFQRAVNWKRYWTAQVRPHIGSCVLEVGAGIGANTPYLNKGAKEWVCLEPDAQMAAVLIQRQRESKFRRPRRAHRGSPAKTRSGPNTGRGRKPEGPPHPLHRPSSLSTDFDRKPYPS